MKKFKYLILILIGAIFLPMSVSAEVKADKELSADSKEVKVFVFRGEGCPHCEDAIEWFKTLEKDYGTIFEVIGYETWNNPDNAQLMQDIVSARSDNAEGVPYIVVGDDAWNGFDESYKDPILKTIQSEYAKEVDKRTDIVKEVLAGTYKSNVPTTDSTDIVSAIILIAIIVLGGCAGGIYYYINNKKKEEVKVTKKVTSKK